MLDKKEFARIKVELDRLADKHVELNKKSRDIIRLSKQLIYSTNRGDLDAAGKYLLEIKKERRMLDKTANTPQLRHYHPYTLAVQEYVEAVCFHAVVSGKKPPTMQQLKADAEAYVMGLSDLTGELVRKAVDDMINERYKQALKLKNLVDEIYGAILGFDMEGGEARRKTDQIKYNLQRLEDLIYDAKIRDKI